MAENRQATAAEIKKYFEVATMKEFKDMWDQRNDEERHTSVLKWAVFSTS